MTIEQIPAEELQLPKFIEFFNGDYLPLEEAIRKLFTDTDSENGYYKIKSAPTLCIFSQIQDKAREISDKYTPQRPAETEEEQAIYQRLHDNILKKLFADYDELFHEILKEEIEKKQKSYLPLGISKDEYIEILQNKLMNTQIQAPNSTPEAKRIIVLICYALKIGKKRFKKSNAELAELFGVTDRQKLRDKIIKAANEVTNIHIDDFTIKGIEKEITYIGGIATCRVEQDTKTKACTLFVSIAPDLIDLIHADDIYFHSLTMHSNDLWLPQRNEADILPLIDYIRTYYRQNSKKPISAATVFKLLYKKPIEDYREPRKQLQKFHDKLNHIHARRGFKWNYCDKYGRLYPDKWEPTTRGELNDAYIIFDIPSSPTDELAESCERRRNAARKKSPSKGKIHKK